MYYWFGVGLVVLAAALLGITHPAIFYGPPDSPGSFLDFSDLFYYGQWIGFWLLTGSLGLFWMLHRASPAVFQPLAKPASVAPVLAVVLLAHFVVFTMPEASNRGSWKRRNLGIKAYLDAKTSFLRERRANQAVVQRFTGAWKAANGVVYSFSANGARMSVGSQGKMMDAGHCGERMLIRYEMNDPGELYTQFMESSDELRRVFGNLVEQPLPIVTCTCDSEYRRFTILPDGRMVGFIGLGGGFFLERI